MYITGSQLNLESRIHQLPTGMFDLSRFSGESVNYTYPASGSLRIKLNREYQHSFLIINGFSITGNLIP